jgi:hypothetical protein
MLVILNLLVLMEMELLLEVTCKNVAVVVLLLINSAEVLTSIHLQVVHSTRVAVLITRDLSAVIVINVSHTRSESSRSFMDVMVMVAMLNNVRKPSAGRGGGGTIRSM